MGLSDPFAEAVCLGLDLAWWGGQAAGGASSWDAIVGNEVGSLQPWLRRVDLRGSRNAEARADLCAANYDANADLLVRAMGEEIVRLSDAGASRFLLAIDAPLATAKVDQPPRRRANKKDEEGGVPRSCDALVAEARSAIGGPWSRVLQVQPGAPLCPRVSRLVERVTTELGFTYWNGLGPLNSLPERTLIEIFPAEAIWALGVRGFLGPAPESIRLYKMLKPGSTVTLQDAQEWAARPLRAFVKLLGDAVDVGPAVETIAAWACADQVNGVVELSKRYDDVVDSGIAWLTAVAMLHGRFHSLVAPDADGHIVGPGELPALRTKAERPEVKQGGAASAHTVGADPRGRCYCGCGAPTGSYFACGHDTRVKSWLLKKHGLSPEQVAARPLAELAVEFGYGPASAIH